MKREKHRAAIALPGAFLLLWGGEPPACLGGRGRRECEDFAPRNGGTRPSGGRGAKRGAPPGAQKNREPSWKVELRQSKSGPALAARFCYPSYLIFMPGSREPCSVLHLGNPVRYRRVPAERYRGLHIGSGNLPPGFPHPRRSWNRNPGF